MFGRKEHLNLPKEKWKKKIEAIFQMSFCKGYKQKYLFAIYNKWEKFLDLIYFKENAIR